jgi:hypothetical protein
MDEEKWAQQSVREVQQRRKERNIRDAKFVAEREMLNACTPQLWGEARSGMQRYMHLFNQTLGDNSLLWIDTVLNKAIIKIRDDPRHEAEATFHPTRLDIECLVVNSRITYTPHVLDGQLVFRANGAEPCGPEVIAMRFVDEIVKFV